MARPSAAIERRAQIVWGLYDCLLTANFDRVTIRDIAQAAGVKSGLIHHYFKDKEEIYAALAETLTVFYVARLEESMGIGEPSSRRADEAVEFVVDELIRDTAVNRVLYNLTQMSLDFPSMRNPIRELFEKYRQNINREFPSPDQGTLVVAIIEGMALQHTIDPERLSRQAMLDLVARVLNQFAPATQERS